MPSPPGISVPFHAGPYRRTRAPIFTLAGCPIAVLPRRLCPWLAPVAPALVEEPA